MSMQIDWQNLAVEIIFLALLAIGGHFYYRHRQKVRDRKDRD